MGIALAIDHRHARSLDLKAERIAQFFHSDGSLEYPELAEILGTLWPGTKRSNDALALGFTAR